MEKRPAGSDGMMKSYFDNSIFFGLPNKRSENYCSQSMVKIQVYRYRSVNFLDHKIGGVSVIHLKITRSQECQNGINWIRCL